MLLDRRTVRDNIRNREGRRVFYLGKGDQLTSDARDYLNRERVEVLPAHLAKQERYRLLNGGFVEGKPEHMTHLNAQVLVPKTHPRIRFRGMMDTLEAEILLCQKQADPALQKQLQEVLTLARNIVRWDVLEEQAEETLLLGLTEQQLRQHSHRPQDFYGVPHFMPQADDPEIILRLNKVRCAVRSAELAAAEAFTTAEGVTRPDLMRMLNRMSSAVYILMIREKGM